MQVDEQPMPVSSSGLQFFLHPLVIINISDHYTRTRVNQGEPAGAKIRVVGCLLGFQSGRTIDITNSFEANVSIEDPKALDMVFLIKRLEQYKLTFPGIDVVGWYTTGDSLSDLDMEVNRQIMIVNAAPALLLLDPAPSLEAQKDLPITLYESELHVIDGAPSSVFTFSTYTMATSEAERIAVDQVAKILPTGIATATSNLTSHMGSIKEATNALSERVAALLSLLRKMQSGKVPYDPVVIRQVAAFAGRLPAADAAGGVPGDNAIEGCDALLTVLLAGLTKGSAQALSLAEKHNMTYYKSGGGGGSGASTKRHSNKPMGQGMFLGGLSNLGAAL